MPNSYYGDSDSYGNQHLSKNYKRTAFDDSPISKMREQYWSTKQNLICKFKKKEDDHLVASDAELDAKLQAYLSVKSTCECLLRCIERYQDCICELSSEENALGRFLKNSGKSDKTQAGKIMAAVGRAQGYTAQQRLALRLPLVRLYQEMEVFIERAVADCAKTVKKVEEARTSYRGSLLWMKNASENLDPETFRQIEKFREVQSRVKRNKSKLDKMKLDCLQKIDLLAASRCNLFSQILSGYQNSLLTFWDKTVKAYAVITDSFKGYQYYEFKILKSLTDPSLKPVEKLEPKPDPAIDQRVVKNSELISLEIVDRPIIRSESTDKFFRDSPDTETVPDFDRLKDELKDVFNHMSKTRNEVGSALASSELSPLLGPNSSEPFDCLSDNDLDIMKTLSDGAHEDSFTFQWENAFGSKTTSMNLDDSKKPNNGTVLLPKKTTEDNDPFALLKVTSNSKKDQVDVNRDKSFLPSELLDLNWPHSTSGTSSVTGLTDKFKQLASFSRQSAKQPATAAAASASKNKPNQADWLNFFADLDPLQNSENFQKTLGIEDHGC